ncbi:MAG: hypothetical protein ACM3QZ_05525 [Solirubrobacterales bacterium]
MENGNHLQLKVRFDYRGKGPKRRAFFGNTSVDKIAEGVREQKVAELRNVPFQGIIIDNIDMSIDVYTLQDDVTGGKIAFAPVLVTLTADSLENAVRFVMNEEFRTVEILQPERLTLERMDIERLLFRVNEELKNHLDLMEKKLEFWR